MKHSPVYSCVIILFSLMLMLGVPGMTTAQGTFTRLQCKGEMPEDFVSRYAEKYKTTLEEGKNGKRATKSQKEFAAMTNIAVDNLFRSGKVLYGDEVTTFCNKVLDIILADDEALREKLRIYTLRTNQVNAFSTHQGIILVTTGLVARLENEAQLAFVLAHEVAHYVKKHSLESYEFNKELFKDNLRNQNSSLDEKLLQSASYSREAEFEADNYGWELYTHAGYSPEDIFSVFDMLLFSYLPISCNEVSYHRFEDDHFKIRDRAKKYNFTEIKTNEEVDDSESTHPNNYKRKKAIYDKLDNSKVSLDSAHYKMDIATFNTVIELARIDAIYNYIINNQYIDALILCDAWDSSGMIGKDFLNNARAMCYYGIVTFVSDRQWNELLREKNLQGYQESYFHMFRKMKREEIYVMACREIWKLHRMDTSNHTVKNLLQSSLAYVNSNKLFNSGYFNADPSDSTKNARQNKRCHTCNLAFNSDDYRGLKAELMSVKASGDLAENDEEEDDEEDEEYEEINSQTYLTDIEKDDLAVERMIVLSPRYFGMDFRKSVDKRFMKAEEKQIQLEQTLERFAGDLGIEIIIPDSRQENGRSTEDFNRYATLMDWMTERSGFKAIEPQSFLQQDISQIRDDYNADYLTMTFYWNYIERKEFAPLVGLLSAVFVYTFPVYLYWQLRPYSYTGYAFLVVDLGSGKFQYGDYKEVDQRYRDYYIKAILYNSLNQIRK